LNINLNSRIAETGLFERTFIPSSPHDAGISVGCAYHGWRSFARRQGIATTVHTRGVTDRLGSAYGAAERSQAVLNRQDLLETPTVATAARIAQLICDGAIVGRFAGRAEFGPRALGGRSLLASPLLASSKDRLNRIKGRQSWRPVAPVIPVESAADHFDGPTLSPYMNFVQTIKPQHRIRLAALVHPDNSARVQTLERAEDPFLHELLIEFHRLTGYPVLVNTSFNGPGEPIVEHPDAALDFLLLNEDLDALLLENELIRRQEEPSLAGRQLAEDVIITWVGRRAARRVILLRGRFSLEVSPELLQIMDTGGDAMNDPRPDVSRILVRAARQGFLVQREASK
jgi:carbamoyltransferase